MKIGLIGTGLLGGPIGEMFVKAGYYLSVYNRTESKLKPLEDLGALAVESPGKLVDCSDVVITVLTDYAAICEVLMKERINFDGKTIIQMSTILPSESILLHQRLSHLGADYIEAPVLGSIQQALTGTLIVMAASPEALFGKWESFFKPVSDKVIHIGNYGSAALVKLALNQLIANLTISFSISLGLLKSNGIDTDKFMDILRGSALYAPTFDKKLKNMLSDDFTNPNFPVKHLHKDVNLILQAAESSGVDSGLLRKSRDLLAEAIREKLAEEDYSAVYRVINPSNRKL